MTSCELKRNVKTDCETIPENLYYTSLITVLFAVIFKFIFIQLKLGLPPSKMFVISKNDRI